MPGKSTEAMAKETSELRFKLHKLVKEGVKVGVALGQLLPGDTNRSKKLKRWEERGLWPIPSEELSMMEIDTTPPVTQNVTETIEQQTDKPVTQETSHVTQEAMPVTEPLIETPQHAVTQDVTGATEQEISAISPVSDKITHDNTDEGLAVTHKVDVVTHGENKPVTQWEPRATQVDIPGKTQEVLVVTQVKDKPVTHEVEHVTQQATGWQEPLVIHEVFTVTQREELEKMIRDIVRQKIEKAPTREKREVSIRPLFKRGETVARSIRISKPMMELAEKRAKEDRAKTGGSFNGLVELMLWEYLGRPAELVEPEPKSEIEGPETKPTDDREV